MKFSHEYLLQQLSLSRDVPGWQVAFSGGLDSTVLLHALVQLRGQLPGVIGAVHVNHGLQADATDWESHCRDFCRQLGVDLRMVQVNAQPQHGESPEATARTARYDALAGLLTAGQVLLTAQHQDDQAETLLLQLLRGAGVSGLAAMPADCSFGAGRLVRPLLAVPRPALVDYAQRHGLGWVEDPSNTDEAYDRNYLRHRVMPVLAARWPSAAASLARSATNLGEAAELLAGLAGQDIPLVGGSCAGTLSVAGLQGLPVARRRNVLRSWLKLQAGQAPSRAVLVRIEHDILASRADAEPAIALGACELRRYRDDLYLLRAAEVTADLPSCHWQPARPLRFDETGYVLSAATVAGQGVRKSQADRHGIEVRWRQGGERCRPGGRAHHHALKKLFQEAGVPPWVRRNTPLLYIDDELAAVGNLWVCEPFCAGADEPGYRIDWGRADRVDHDPD